MKKFISSFATVLILSAMASCLTSCEPASVEDDNSLLNGILGDDDTEDTEMVDSDEEEEVPYAPAPTYGPDEMPE